MKLLNTKSHEAIFSASAQHFITRYAAFNLREGYFVYNFISKFITNFFMIFKK